MTQQQHPQQTEDAREADDMGEKPDLGRTPDALTEAVSGSGMGSDTRAGSLEGGAATGSEIDPDQDRIDKALAEEGKTSAAPRPPVGTNPDQPVNNTGHDFTGPAGDPAEGKPGVGDGADAATG
ncbi:ribonuclease [Brevundimonas sp.]|uniref:ribonuclease n=1 Tax=Brevundimonas sp. TaxID=1871086 RepID=UPI002D6286E1|nr:ribonuclease [Brevundimonas sp.]HYC99203.1 ribonuclease [Brevundimonas sp.]